MRTEPRTNDIGFEVDWLVQQIDLFYDYDFKDSYCLKIASATEEQLAIKMVTESMTMKDCQYEIGLPWRDDSIRLLDKRMTAGDGLNGLKRFLRDLELFVGCSSNGQAEVAPNENLRKDYEPRLYLPHQTFANPKRPTKLSAVFDCIARFRGHWLNYCLPHWPDTTTSLAGVPLWFRRDAIVLAADVKEMSMQLRVPVRQGVALRLL